LPFLRQVAERLLRPGYLLVLASACSWSVMRRERGLMTGSPPWDPGSNRDRQDSPYPPQSGSRQQQPQHAGWGSAAAAQGSFTCRLCGSIPAENATFRRVQGLILLVRLWRVHGPFCRDCGLAVFRDQTAKTLVQGWWGVPGVLRQQFRGDQQRRRPRPLRQARAPRRNPGAPALYPRPLQPRSSRPTRQRRQPGAEHVPASLLGR
jgi:hypothetical protein